jgi:hypothetical protein
MDKRGKLGKKLLAEFEKAQTDRLNFIKRVK